MLIHRLSLVGRYVIYMGPDSNCRSGLAASLEKHSQITSERGILLPTTVAQSTPSTVRLDSINTGLTGLPRRLTG